jgi:hypothetical protein
MAWHGGQHPSILVAEGGRRAAALDLVVVAHLPSKDGRLPQPRRQNLRWRWRQGWCWASGTGFGLMQRSTSGGNSRSSYQLMVALMSFPPWRHQLGAPLW